METTTDTAKSETTSGGGGATASDGAKNEATSDGGGATASDDAKSETTSGGSGSDGAPKSYSRGENQKPVTDAYRENWNDIFRRGKPRRR